MYTRNRKIKKGCENNLYKIKKGIKVVCIVFAIILLNFLNFANSVIASNLNTANVQAIGDCGSLLKYKGSIVKTTYIEYENEGKRYPAYCLDKTKPGAEVGSYTVSVDRAIQDVMLWKIVTNGYPYKTIGELGVANEKEAFTATKHAIYSYIHGNQFSDYEAIGEAGQRTLNAMYKIINDANNSSEVQISNQVDIQKLQEYWEQDLIELHYVSKTYKVNAKTNIDNYKVHVTDENGEIIEGIKITDENNHTKTEFAQNEIFKILIPIKSMTADKKIKITIETKVETKPVLYGTAPNSGLQDYALTASTYEDGSGNIQDTYTKNETKIVIVKQDEETKEKLQGVEFQLLDENKNVIYSNLQTDENGMVKIENLPPGTYYIKEARTIDGYEIYENLIKVNIALQEEVTITVNNHKEEEPKIEKKMNKKEARYQKILPITGM